MPKLHITLFILQFIAYKINKNLKASALLGIHFYYCWSLPVYFCTKPQGR